MPKKRNNTKKIPASIHIVRWIIGLLFIFSGLIKANDPLGLSYKMQEFFDVWGVSFLNPLSLALAYVMNICEVLAGVAVLLGYGMVFFSWFLLWLIIGFAFLTGYASLSGQFKTCGCFGDCLPIPPIASFGKDILLLVLIIVLFVFRKKIQPLFRWRYLSITLLLGTIVGTIVLQQYVLGHLPIKDCLPYRVGSNLLEGMAQPKGSIPDSTVITFKYKHNGHVVEFDAEHFPTDFDEANYTYVDRYDKVVRKGTAEPAIKDFVLMSQDNQDTTLPVLSNPEKYILVMIRDFDRWDRQAAAFNSALQAAKRSGLKIFLISPNIKAAPASIPSDVIKLSLDAVALKTAARVNATYFLMKGPVVLEKKSFKDIKAFLESI